jgi:hypothetical protein
VKRTQGSHVRRAAWLAGGWLCAVVVAVVGVVNLLPDGISRDNITFALLQPQPIIATGLERIVNLIGPKGRPEPASHYLSHSVLVSLGGLSILLYLGTVFAAAYLCVGWFDHRRDSVSGHNESASHS